MRSKLFRLFTVSAVLTVSVLSGPVAAFADPVYPPLHKGPSALRLIGASSEGIALQQDGAVGDESTTILFTGSEGKSLTPHTFGQFIDSAPRYFGVSGPSLAWVDYGFSSQIMSQAYTMDLATGRDNYLGMTGLPLAVVGNHWLSTQPLTRSAYPFTSAELHELTPRKTDPPSFSDRKIGTIDGLYTFAADETWAVDAWCDLPCTDGSAYHLDRITLSDGTHQRVADSATPIESVAVGSGKIAWLSRHAQQAPVLHYRAVTGGPVTDWSDPDVPTPSDQTPLPLVSGEAGVAYLTATRAGSSLRMATDTGVHSVSLPPDSNGLAAVGDRFLTAAGGGSATAGVYSIGADSTLTRTTTVPERGYSQTFPVLNAGRLYWNDDFGPSVAGKNLWSRPIRGRTSVRLGAEVRFRLPVLRTFGSSDPNFSVSAGRLARVARGAQGRTTTVVFDRGHRTGIIEGGKGQSLAVSGPYVALGSTVHTPDGSVLYRADHPETIRSVALFGSQMIYSQIGNPKLASPTYSIWLVDALNPHPRRLRAKLRGYCGYGQQVAIWADTVAWVNCPQHTITVQNLRTGTVRKVPTGQQDEYSETDLRLSEGVLAWSTGGNQTRVLDLTHRRSHPVRLPGYGRQPSVDYGYVARTVDPNTDRGEATTRVQVQALPFHHSARPRLLGTLAVSRLRPGAHWRPQFDATQPLTNIRLTITDADGRTVRVLRSGTAQDGSVRGLSWKGPRVPGVYTWRLTAVGTDGLLIASRVLGRATTGTVTVLR